MPHRWSVVDVIDKNREFQNQPRVRVFSIRQRTRIYRKFGISHAISCWQNLAAVFLFTTRTLSYKDGDANDDGSEKSHFWFTLYFFERVIRLCERKTIKCFSKKVNKYWEHFCHYVLIVSRTLEKVFLRSNISDNYVQVLSSIYSISNVQLLYLLLFFYRRLPHCKKSQTRFAKKLGVW